MYSRNDHYEDMPMQYKEIFSAVKIENVIGKILIYMYLIILVQNIDRGYMLEPPRRGGCNDCYEYPQSMFWTKNKNQRTSGPANAHLRSFI